MKHVKAVMFFGGNLKQGIYFTITSYDLPIRGEQ